jgi:hypothetical protein
MQISYPARHFIYYRISQRKDPLDKIIEDLGQKDLPLPQDLMVFQDFVKKVRAFKDQLEIPSAFDPTAKVLNATTVAFLKKWGIQGIWLRDPDVLRAEDYLYEGPIRMALEVMLLGPIAPSTIAERIRQRFGLSEKVMNTAVVRAYAHYFWDTRCWTPSQWATAIFEWMPKGDKTSFLMALRAPRTPTGAAMVLGMADNDIETMDPAAMFDVMRHFGMRMFMQHATTELSSFARTQGALAAFQIAQQAADAVDRFRGGNNELLAAIGRVSVRQVGQTYPTIYDLPAQRNDGMSNAPRLVVDSTAETIDETTDATEEKP